MPRLGGGYAEPDNADLARVSKIIRNQMTRLHQDIARVVNSAEYSKFILQQGAEPALMDPKEFGAYIKSEKDKWEKVIKAAGLYQSN